MELTETGRLGGKIRNVYRQNALSMLAVVAYDGLVLEEASLPEVDAEAIAAVAASSFLVMDGIAQELGEREARIITLEFDHNILTMTPLNDECLLLMISEPNAMNLGQVRLILSRTVHSVREGFEESTSL